MPITQDNADILIISDGAGRRDAQGALRGVFAVADWPLDATLDTSGPDNIVERPVVIDVDLTQTQRTALRVGLKCFEHCMGKAANGNPFPVEAVRAKTTFSPLLPHCYAAAVHSGCNQIAHETRGSSRSHRHSRSAQRFRKRKILFPQPAFAPGSIASADKPSWATHQAHAKSGLPSRAGCAPPALRFQVRAADFRYIRASRPWRARPKLEKRPKSKNATLRDCASRFDQTCMILD